MELTDADNVMLEIQEEVEVETVGTETFRGVMTFVCFTVVFPLTNLSTGLRLDSTPHGRVPHLDVAWRYFLKL